MTTRLRRTALSRRGFLKLAGRRRVRRRQAPVACPQYLSKVLMPSAWSEAADPLIPTCTWRAPTAGLDLPPNPSDRDPYFPDDLRAADPIQLRYIFGFRNVTGLTATQISAQKDESAAQRAAVLGRTSTTRNRLRQRVSHEADQPGPADAPGPDRLAHAALARLPQRLPVLRRRADRLRSPSRSAAASRYVYRPHDPGTYMYHCHVEDVEHVHMGMTGLVFVRPIAERQHQPLPERQVRLQRRRRIDRLRPRVRHVPAARCGPKRTGLIRTSSFRTGPTSAPTSA